MAKCEYKMPEDFLERIARLGECTDEVIPKVLKAGGEVALGAVRSNLNAVLSGESSGQLQAALGVSPAKMDRNGNYNVKVGFDEYRRDGSSNAMVDTYELFADNKPGFETQEARLSLYSKGNYLAMKQSVLSALLAADFTIESRQYIGHEDDTGYHHYSIDFIKVYPVEED